jgi:N-acetylneuraminic acid mutarotase
MAYDAATGNVVLFGGIHHNDSGNVVVLGDTWTWDGSTWTRQHPAVHPSGRFGAAMGYDAATGNVVLFGGANSSVFLSSTWIWDGSTWTQQHPATAPPARIEATMAYDAATSKVVLFGGANLSGAGGGDNYLGDTWTWG